MAAQTVNFSMNVDEIFNPVYVAVATGVNTCQSNTDPRSGTWTSRTMPVSSAWIGVDYGEGMITAISSTSGQIAATTIDGTTWIQRTLPTSTTWAALKFGYSNGIRRWIAVSSAGNYAATSPDGCTWTAQSITGTAYAWKSIAYGNGTWVAIASAAESNTLRTAVTTDGITWSNNVTTSITCPGTWSSIYYGNGRFVAVCSGSNVAAYSTDGTNWTATTLPESTAWVSVTYGNSVWIAVTATNSANAARSTDNGATWNQITFPAASTWRAVIYGRNLAGEGIFTTIGATTVSNYSLDNGITWYAKTQVTMTYTAACYAPITWYSNDTVTINNGAVVTVNTEQKQFWSAMTISNGTLNISNSSSSTGITFATGRVSGTTAGTITPSSGLGKIVMSGDWIELGTGSGVDNQTLTAPFTDYIPSVWVETGNGTNQYEMWANVTGAYGDGNPIMYEGLNSTGSEKRGRYFTQDAESAPYGPLSLDTTSAFINQRATRYLKVSSTSGVISGASLQGPCLTANTVVNKIISSTELEINQPTLYPVNTDWSTLCYGNGTWVALSKSMSDIAMTSTNSGVTWTKRQMPFKAEWKGICYGATSARFVAVCHNSLYCAVSSDGITWTRKALINTLNWKAVATNGTSFVAVGATTGNAATTIAAYSADGLTWAAATMATSAIWQAVCYGNSRYVAVSSTYNSNYDTDGSGTWTAGGTLTAGNFVGIAYTGSRFVAISGNSTVTRYSTDATSWSTGGTLPNSAFTGICWTGSYLVAVSNQQASNQAVTSTDGASWTNRTLANGNFNAVAYGNSVTIALGGASNTAYTGSLVYTSDATGVTWTIQTGLVTDVSFMVFNPYKNQLTSTIRFGNGINGNLIPIGAKVRCPNIMVTNLTAANVQTASNTIGTSFVMTNGGSATISRVLFDEAYHNFAQAQSVSITDCGFAIPFLISECYNFTLNRVTFALQPVRRYWTNPQWYTRDLRFGQNVAWSYLNNAVVNDLRITVGGTMSLYGSASAANAPITLSYTDNITFLRYHVASLNSLKSNQTGLLGSALVTNSTFTDCEFYGCASFIFTLCNNNTFTNTIVAPGLFSGKKGTGTSGTRIGINPATGEKLIDNTKYYFKVRSYRDATDMTEYVEGPVVSSTPFISSDPWFVPYFSAVNTASATVTFNWARREPSAATVAVYEIFRGTSPGFTRNLASRIYTTATSSTVTTTDATVTNGNTYYYVMRKYSGSLAGITNSSGTSGQYTLGTSQNFLTGLGTIANCIGTAGTRKVYLLSGVATNFLSGFVRAGMPISGGGLAAGTTVTSVDNELEITVSQNITSDFEYSTLSLGACAGMYISGTNIVAGTKVQSVDSSTQITTDIAFSGTVSGTITFLWGTEGPEVEVYVSGARQTASNLLLQSYDFTSSTWTKTNMTATGAIFFPPEQVGFNAGTAPTALGTRLLSIGPSANIVQTLATLTSSTSYCFSMYVRTEAFYYTGNVVSVTITINTSTPTTYTFNATAKWQRIEVPFTSTSTTHTFTVTINDDGAYIYASNLQVNTGNTATTPVTTTTTAVTLNPVVQEITALYAWGRSTGGNTTNQGIELALAAAPTGTHYSNVFMGTSSDFTPGPENLVESTMAASWSVLSLTSSTGNTVDGIIQEEKGQLGTLFTLVGSSDNIFKDVDFDFNYAASVLVNISNLSNNNLFHNIHVENFRNFLASSSLTTVNNASSNIFQNCYFDTFDCPIRVNNLDCILKGISGGNATPAAASTTWALGGTSDGIGVVYTTVYDTNFHEMYHSPTTGALNLLFNDSSKAIKPYTVLAGSPVFSNTGRLYFDTTGYSIEFEWPHLIRGVTGFRNLKPKLNGLDLGTAVDTLHGLEVQFCIDQGSGYSSYTKLTGPNLYAVTIADAETGFRIKIKITSKTGMKFTGQSNAFVKDEQIRGVTSLATAYVREIYDLGTTGDIIVDTVSGNFIAGETIVRHSDAQARATNLATNTNFALFPSFTSYIDGLQIYTIIDPDIHYPTALPEVTLTGLKTGSEVHAYSGTNPDTAIEIGAIESTPGSTFTFAHEYGGTSGYIVIMCQGYQLIRLSITYPVTDSSIPIQQIIDRVYYNPV